MTREMAQRQQASMPEAALAEYSTLKTRVRETLILGNSGGQLLHYWSSPNSPPAVCLAKQAAGAGAA